MAALGSKETSDSFRQLTALGETQTSIPVLTAPTSRAALFHLIQLGPSGLEDAVHAQGVTPPTNWKNNLWFLSRFLKSGRIR